MAINHSFTPLVNLVSARSQVEQHAKTWRKVEYRTAYSFARHIHAIASETRTAGPAGIRAPVGSRWRAARALGSNAVTDHPVEMACGVAGMVWIDRRCLGFGLR